MYVCTHRLQGAGFDDCVVAVLVVGEAKEDVLPDCAREHPGVLRGIGDTPTHGDVSFQGIQLPQQTLKQGRLHREEKWT